MTWQDIDNIVRLFEKIEYEDEDFIKDFRNSMKVRYETDRK